MKVKSQRKRHILKSVDQTLIKQAWRLKQEEVVKLTKLQSLFKGYIKLKM